MEAETHAFTGRRRLASELKEYAGISLYLYACFGVILFYKGAVLEAHGIGYAPYGLAAAKALILGKFILIGHAIHAGERYRQKPLVYDVLYTSVVFLVALVALSLIEEAVAGAIHGRTVAETIAQIVRGRWMEIAATCVLLWLILLPYLGFRRVREGLGDERLRRVLFGKTEDWPSEGRVP
jgi:hypothetical protein